MANTKTSDEPDGSPAEETDIVAIVRDVSGTLTDFQVPLSDIADLVSVPGNPGVISVSSSRTLTINDAWDTLLVTATATLTIPTNASVAFSTGTIISLVSSSGTLTVTADSGVTLNGVTAGSVSAAAASSGSYSQISLTKIGTDAWAISLGGVA